MKSSALLIALLAWGGGSTDAPGQTVDVEAARKNVDALTPEGMRAALDTLPTTSTDPAVLGLRERAAGLGELLYAIAADPVDDKLITKGGPGWRDHVIGAAARRLARAKGIDELAQLARLLDPEIADDPRDPWLLSAARTALDPQRRSHAGDLESRRDRQAGDRVRTGDDRSRFAACPAGRGRSGARGLRQGSGRRALASADRDRAVNDHR